jgi:glutaredoxin
MTLFTKPDCQLCAQLKSKFDLKGMDVNIEILDTGDAGALAHLAWHGLVETARKTLPILVLDDSSTVDDFTDIESLLMSRAEQCGLKYNDSPGAAIVCKTGTCAIN